LEVKEKECRRGRRLYCVIVLVWQELIRTWRGLYGCTGCCQTVCHRCLQRVETSRARRLHKPGRAARRMDASQICEISRNSDL